MTDLAQLTEDEVGSELFHSETLIAEAHAEEKRQLRYMLLGGSPAALVAVFWQFWGNARWVIGIAVLLFTLWHTVRWTVAARRASTLEERHKELTEIQEQLTTKGESALGPAAVHSSRRQEPTGQSSESPPDQELSLGSSSAGPH